MLKRGKKASYCCWGVSTRKWIDFLFASWSKEHLLADWFRPFFWCVLSSFLFCLFVSFGLHEMNNAVHTLLQLANYFPLNGPFFFVHVVFFSLSFFSYYAGFPSTDVKNSAGLWFGAAYRSFCTHNAMPIDSRSAHNVSSDDVWHITSS